MAWCERKRIGYISVLPASGAARRVGDLPRMRARSLAARATRSAATAIPLRATSWKSSAGHRPRRAHGPTAASSSPICGLAQALYEKVYARGDSRTYQGAQAAPASTAPRAPRRRQPVPRRSNALTGCAQPARSAPASFWASPVRHDPPLPDQVPRVTEMVTRIKIARPAPTLIRPASHAPQHRKRRRNGARCPQQPLGEPQTPNQRTRHAKPPVVGMKFLSNTSICPLLKLAAYRRLLDPLFPIASPL